MSIKDVLVVLDSGSYSEAVGDYALSFASSLGAHLTAAIVTLETIAPVSFMGDYPFDLMTQAIEEARAQSKKTADRFKAAAPAGVTLEFVDIESFSGEAQARLSSLSRHFDITIIGQGGPDSPFDSGFATSAVMGSGRPAILLPYIHKGPAKFDRAMVAWDGGMVATRAIAGAMPLLRRAKQVELVTILARKEPENELPGFNITRHLARHGVQAQLKQLPPTDDIPGTLLSHAADTAPDFLVMGCYGHSRLREIVLGGTTREILSSMTVPVVMAH